MKNIMLIICIAATLISCAPPEVKKGPSVFYPPLPQEPRLQFLTGIRSEEDLEKKRSQFDEFLLGEEPVTKIIGRPFDIGTTKGKIYISDRFYKKILIIDLEKNTFDYLNDIGEGIIEDNGGIWVDEDGSLYVSDIKRKQILVYDSAQNFVRAYGESEQFERPLDVAVHENRIYVCDHGKHKIIVLDKNSGQTIQEIGGFGKEEGQFFKPTHVVTDHEGNVFVDDNFNFRIPMFSPEGKYIKTFGFHGDVSGALARPKGVAVDREKHVYVADAAFENIQIFDVEKEDLLLFFATVNTGPGGSSMPAGLHVDYDNVEYFQKFADKNFKLKYVLYVGNLMGVKRLKVYGFGEWVGAPLSGAKK